MFEGLSLSQRKEGSRRMCVDKDCTGFRGTSSVEGIIQARLRVGGKSSRRTHHTRKRTLFVEERSPEGGSHGHLEGLLMRVKLQLTSSKWFHRRWMIEVDRLFGETGVQISRDPSSTPLLSFGGSPYVLPCCCSSSISVSSPY